MSGGNCKLELDIFSGRQNPLVEITKEEFAAIYSEVLNLEKANPIVLFDGLGFRGFILSASNTTMIVQKKIIKVQSEKGAQWRKNNQKLILKLIKLIKTYDNENVYEMLIENIREEYL